MHTRNFALPPTRSLVLAVVSAVLAAGLLVALLNASAQAAQRDARIGSLTAANSDLQNARSALRDDVSRLTREREQLLRTQRTIQTQLADAKAESDKIAGDRDRLQAEATHLKTENEALTKKLAAPAPAPVAAAAASGPDRAAVAKVLDLDAQIEQKFNLFYQQLQAVLASFGRGDLLSAKAGYQQASQTADQIKDLFSTRNKAAEPLR